MTNLSREFERSENLQFNSRYQSLQVKELEKSDHSVLTTNKLELGVNAFGNKGGVETMNDSVESLNISFAFETPATRNAIDERRSLSLSEINVNGDSKTKFKPARGVLYLKNGIDVLKPHNLVEELADTSDEENISSISITSSERSESGKQQLNSDVKELHKLEVTFNMYLRNASYMVSNFKVVFGVCTSIQDAYFNIILSHFNWSIEKRFDLRLWRSVFHTAINFYRNQSCPAQLNILVDNCVQFYKKLIKELGVKFNFKLSDIPYFHGKCLEQNVLIAVQRCLIILGDLSRYKSKAENPKCIKIAISYYSNASKVIPMDPKPHYLLSIIFFSTDSYLTTLFYVYKTLKYSSLKNPIIDNAREELTTLYEKLRRKIPFDSMDSERKSLNRRFEIWKTDAFDRKISSNVDPLTIFTYTHTVLFLNIGMEAFDNMCKFIMDRLGSILRTSSVNKVGYLLHQISFISVFSSENDFSHKATRRFALDLFFNIVHILLKVAAEFANTDEHDRTMAVVPTIAYFINWICTNELEFPDVIFSDLEKLASALNKDYSLGALPCLCPSCQFADDHKPRNYNDIELEHFNEIVVSFIELIKPKYSKQSNYDQQSNNAVMKCSENDSCDDLSENEDVDCWASSTLETPPSNVLALYRKMLSEKMHSFNRRKDAVIHYYASKPVMLSVNPKFLVVDTNCFIRHLDSLKELVDNFTLVVPLIVYLELRQMIRTKMDDLHHCALNSLEWLNDCSKKGKIKIVNSEGITIACPDTYPNETCKQNSSCNDDLILICCVNLSKWSETNDDHLSTDVVLLTGDRNLRLKAHARKIPSRNVPELLKEITK